MKRAEALTFLAGMLGIIICVRLRFFLLARFLLLGLVVVLEAFVPEGVVVGFGFGAFGVGEAALFVKEADLVEGALVAS